VKENFGVNHVIDVLRGAGTDAIRTWGHQKLSTFGILNESLKEELRDWIFQLIAQGALVQTAGERPVLQLNRESWAVMNGRKPARLVQLDPYAEAAAVRTRAPGALPPGADGGLFEELRVLRRAEAAKAGIQPYMVFPDTVLAELARGRPTTEADLLQVSGVGEYRLKAFGRVFLDAIRDYCRRTGLPTDVPPQKANPATPARAGALSVAKSLAYQLFRIGTSVADVIEHTQMPSSTVVGYLADYIAAERLATIEQWVPKEVIDRIAAAAKIHGTARLKPIFEELKEEVSYDHIRVVVAWLQSRAR
jgi:ATP-dependent DNA helicase RecQ